jgi:CO/xanthine dehydrogenase Mo-binding subunit
MVDGQIRGGFAQAVGAALYEEYAYGSDGSFLTGTLADYLLPTMAKVPDPLILHMQTPSPFTTLGSPATFRPLLPEWQALHRRGGAAVAALPQSR